MELRSGTVVSSGTQFTSAEQARAACLGQARVQLPPANRPVFETAVRGVLQRWTALRLAVENDWAGEQTSDKAAELEASLLGWFYSPGDHYADELEDHLDEFMLEELHVECEDGSPAEVSTLLVHVFELCARGDMELAMQLAHAQAPQSALEQSQKDVSDKRWTLQNGPPQASGAAALAHDVTPDDLAAALGCISTRGEVAMEEEEEALEDGWERVPRRGGGRRK